ncbi:MAG: DUF3617 domain-containing protein [Comamonadaceae bacterium]|nr:MAG: DUF3617 domain-containing protein [Comamonadaceae bacterium]
MKARHLLTAAACAALCLPAAAQQLKPGLWEVTNKMGGNPQMDQAMAQMQQQMASMPPAQRKQMEDMMAKQGVQVGAGAGGISARICMTKEMVEQSPVPMQQQGDCKFTTQQRSGNTYKMAYSCANPPSSGEGEYTFLGPEAYKGKMTVVSNPRGKPETMTMEGSGKWLGADCGAVKPFPMPKK